MQIQWAKWCVQDHSKSSLVVIQSPSHVWKLWPHGLQLPGFPVLHYLPVCSNSCPLSQWSSNHLIFCHPLLLPSIFPSIRVFYRESALHINWPKYWNFSFSISPSNEYSGLISFRIDRFDLLAVQGTLKSLLQNQLKASIFRSLAFFMVQFSYLRFCSRII